MGQGSSKTTKRNISKCRAKDCISKEVTSVTDEEVLPPSPITFNISGRTYALKDDHWLLEASNDQRPFERDPKANKISDILTRENASLRLKISRLHEMLNVNQDTGRLSILEKRVDGSNLLQESKISTVRIQADNAPTSSIPRHLSSPTPPTSLPFKISDSECIARRLEGVLFGVGQPLLDVVAKVTVEFLDSFNLPEEEVHEIRDNEMGMVNLLFEVFPVEYLTGGSAQNCLLMSQWLFGVPKATTFAGCIGKDSVGDILTKTLTEAGVNIILRVLDGHETGLCLVFESCRGRRMALRVGAASSSIRPALDQPQHSALLRKAHCFYAEAYTLTYALDAALELGRFAAANDRYFCLNLSAAHASVRPAQGVSELLPYADFIFAGETDVQAYAAMLGLCTAAGGLEDSVIGLSGWRKENGLRGRVVVVTRPTKDTVVVSDGELAMFPSMTPGAGNIVDDIGFGDAFAGAFMAVLILGGSMDECLEAGTRAATYTLFMRGCTPPKSYTSSIRKLSRRESITF